MQTRKITYFYKEKTSNNHHQTQYILMFTHKFHETKVKTINFFSKTKIIDNKRKTDIKHLIIHLTVFHHLMKNLIFKIINNPIKTKDSTLAT